MQTPFHCGKNIRNISPKIYFIVNSWNLANSISSDEIYNEGLTLIEDKLLAISGKVLSDFGFLPPKRNIQHNLGNDYLRETMYNTEEQLNFVEENEIKLTEEQAIVYHEILESVNGNHGKIYFLDVPGGTGKTFLTNLLLAKVRSVGKIAIAVASSGIAATLIHGGRTSHSTFKLPHNMSYGENPVCNTKKGSSLARLLQECSIIFWDDCTMSHKGEIEASDRTLRDLRNSEKVMGGVTVVFFWRFSPDTTSYSQRYKSRRS